MFSSGVVIYEIFTTTDANCPLNAEQINVTVISVDRFTKYQIAFLET